MHTNGSSVFFCIGCDVVLCAHRSTVIPRDEGRCLSPDLPLPPLGRRHRRDLCALNKHPQKVRARVLPRHFSAALQWEDKIHDYYYTGELVKKRRHRLLLR